MHLHAAETPQGLLVGHHARVVVKQPVVVDVVEMRLSACAADVEASLAATLVAVSVETAHLRGVALFIAAMAEVICHKSNGRYLRQKSADFGQRFFYANLEDSKLSI